MSPAKVTAPEDDAKDPMKGPPKERPRDERQRALKALTYAIGAGCLGILIYAINSAGFLKGLTCFATGLMVAGASLLIGGLLGFLFGIPRTLQGANAPAPRNQNKQGNDANPETNPPAPESSPTSTEYHANTNLEQISDWLTKILVGVGLTQVREISSKMNEVAGGVAWALGAPTGNRSFALSLILYFLIIGFLFAYLWTRLYMTEAFRASETKLDRVVESVDMIRSTVNLVKAKTEVAQATAGLGIGKGASDAVQKILLEAGDQIQPGPNKEDPWKGQFGGKSVNADRKLSATVTPIAGRSGLYSIHLSVSTTNTSRPLTGAVQFFLHPSFKNDKPVVPVGPDGVAELDLVAWGAFTVGALADDGQTKLELDLSALGSAPPEFRAR